MAIRSANTFTGAYRTASLPTISPLTMMASFYIESVSAGVDFRNLLALFKNNTTYFSAPYVWVGLRDTDGRDLGLEVFDGTNYHLQYSGIQVPLATAFHVALRITGNLHEVLYTDATHDAQVVLSVTANSTITTPQEIDFYAEVGPGGKTRLTNGKVFTAALTAAQIRSERDTYSVIDAADVYSAPRFRWASDLRDSSGQGRVFSLFALPGTLEQVDGFDDLAGMEPFAEGTMLIPGADLASPSFSAPEDAVVLSLNGGTILGYLPHLPTAETGDILPNGVFALTKQVSPGVDIEAIELYNAITGARVATIPKWSPPSNWYEYSPIRADGVQFYFLAIPKGGGAGTTAYLYTISDAGVVGGVSWSLPSDANRGASAMAPARDGSVVYYGKSTGGVTTSTAIGVMRLSDSVQLTDLIPAATGQTIGRDLLVTEDGDILVPYFKSSASGGSGLWEVRRYSSGGTLLDTLTLETGAATADHVELGRDPSNETLFWVRTYPSTTHTRFRQVQMSDMAVLHDTGPIAMFDGTTTTIPVSCPFLLMPSENPSAIREVIGPLIWIEWPRAVHIG